MACRNDPADELADSSKNASSPVRATIAPMCSITVRSALCSGNASWCRFIAQTRSSAARLSFTLATVGELPPQFRLRPWHQPIGLHVTAGLGVAIAIGLPLESISSISSSIFLIVFAVVNAAAYRTGARAAVTRPIAMLGAVACATSLVILTVRSASDDRVSLVVLALLLCTALVAERSVLRHRRAGAPTGG